MNRDRLIEGQIGDGFMEEVLRAADQRRLPSHEHFTVDGRSRYVGASQQCAHGHLALIR